MLAIFAAITALTIYITRSGWWIIALFIAFSFIIQHVNDDDNENPSKSEVYPTSKYPQNKN